MSLLGAITPLVKVADGRKIWFRCLLLYTAGGCVSSTIVGMTLGAVGGFFVGRFSGGQRLFLIGSWAMILALRELNLLGFALPELKRQTEKVWAQEFGMETAAAMWGVHIGLGFGTRITYGGFWVLVAVALFFGSPGFGAVLLLTYWLGRALPVWVAPMLVDSTSQAMELPAAILSQGRLYHRLVGATLLSTVVICVIAVVRGLSF